MTGRPTTEPIGLQLARTAKATSRAFDAALGDAGGSVPVWLILVSLKTGGHAMQRELAAAVGIEGPTLTHHLDRLERDGLVSRERDPANRRIQRVALTDAGDAAFFRLAKVVRAFDRRLRAGFDDDEIATLAALLTRLHGNVADPTHAMNTTEVPA